MNEDLAHRTTAAVQYYWRTRLSQRDRESSTGSMDPGRQSAVGGKHMDAFAGLVVQAMRDGGLPLEDVYHGVAISEALPGFFRATKRWDVLAVHGGRLVAAVELKSLTGPSYGNNLNNRVEEALGSADDFWTAYREEAFGKNPRPWLGYIFALEDAPAANRPVRHSSRHFPVDQVFVGASYAERAQLLCERLVLERKYDSAWFLSMKQAGEYVEPSPMVSGRAFLAAVTAHTVAALSLPNPAAASTPADTATPA